MDNHTGDQKRIAKNTVMLYIRMIVIMIVTLYTTRVVLNVLGETDYGIYTECIDECHTKILKL